MNVGRTVDKRIADAVKQLVRWLVEGDYAKLTAHTHGVRFTEEMIAQAINEYGETLVWPPVAAFEDCDVVEVEGAIPRQWSVRFPLWTADVGKSDLTLEVTLIERSARDGELRSQLDDIHVL